jgi:hypothetical protein
VIHLLLGIIKTIRASQHKNYNDLNQLGKASTTKSFVEENKQNIAQSIKDNDEQTVVTHRTQESPNIVQCANAQCAVVLKQCQEVMETMNCHVLAASV